MTEEILNASDVAPRSEERWDTATKAMIGLTVVACLLLVPAVAHASIFTSVITSVSNIGTIEGQISKLQSSVNSFNSTVVAPLQQLNSLKSWLGQAESAYQGYFTSIKNISISSSSLPNTSSLENALRIGYSGGTNSGISGNFTSVYGARISTSVASQSVATQVDMQDSTAQEAMALATNSDAATTKLLSTAQTLEQESSSTAPGTADQISAESLALQLHSQAMMHHLLASMLRQEAGKLASQTAQVKRQATVHANIMTNTFGGNQ